MPFSKEVFGRHFACQRCGVTLLVSETYDRALVLLSILLSFGLLWLSGILEISSDYGCFGFALSLASGFPLAFVLLMGIVRIVPSFIPPQLVRRHNTHITTLDLGRTN